MTKSAGRNEHGEKPGKKRKWERPMLKSERLFETSALACSKTRLDGGDQCQTKDPVDS